MSKTTDDSLYYDPDEVMLYHEYYDSERSLPFYHNANTGTSSWERPPSSDAIVERKHNFEASKISEDVLSGKDANYQWKKAYDHHSGNSYYYLSSDGISQWSCPEEYEEEGISWGMIGLLSGSSLLMFGGGFFHGLRNQKNQFGQNIGSGRINKNIPVWPPPARKLLTMQPAAQAMKALGYATLLSCSCMGILVGTVMYSMDVRTPQQFGDKMKYHMTNFKSSLEETIAPFFRSFHSKMKVEKKRDSKCENDINNMHEEDSVFVDIMEGRTKT